jgi:hypothetical protein
VPSSWTIDIAGQYGQQGPQGIPGASAPGPPGATGPVGPGYAATSTTSFPIATGPVTFATQSGLAYSVGARARVASQSDPTQWMEGTVTAYSGTSLTINVDLTSATTFAAPPVLPNYLGGLTLANDATTPNTVIDIASGGATSDDNTVVMILGSGWTKNANAPWAPGSGNGALAAGAGSTLAANTWYHVFLIQRPDTRAVDILVGISATAPTLPANYTKKRRIGSFCADGNLHILPFVQLGDQFLWVTPQVNLNNTGIAAGGTWYLLALSVPLGVKCEAIIHADMNSNAPVPTWVCFVAPDATPSAPGGPPPGVNFQLTIQATTVSWLTGEFRVRTNTASQINVGTDKAWTSGLYVYTIGYIDYRGR